MELEKEAVDFFESMFMLVFKDVPDADRPRFDVWFRSVNEHLGAVAEGREQATDDEFQTIMAARVIKNYHLQSAEQGQTIFEDQPLTDSTTYHEEMGKRLSG